MQFYKAPLKDYKFLIKDFLNSGSAESVLKNSDIELEDLDMILDEAAKLCEETLLPINQSGDTEGCSFDKGKVTTPKGFKEAYNSFVENGWQGITVNKQYGGQKKSTGRKKSDTSSRRSKSKHSSAGRQNTRTPSFQTPIGKFGFGVSTMFGATIPMGTNLKSNFSSGSNFGIHLDTPLSFNVGSMEAKVGTEVYFSSMSAASSGGSPYKLTNIAGTISLFPLKSIEVKAGLGVSPSSIGDYSKILFSIPIDINYHLPFSVKGFGMALNLHAQETLGIPTDIGTEDTKATSEFINVGFFITTPLVF